MPSRIHLLWFAAVICAISACTGNQVYDNFVRSSEKDSAGCYSFLLDMSDSLTAYDISFYTRLDIKDKDFGNMGNIRVGVRLVSPSGEEYEENVYIPKTSFSRKTAFTKDCNVIYRKETVPSAFGKWKLYLSVDEDRVPGLCGMGVRLERR